MESEALIWVTAAVYWCLIVIWGGLLILYWREHRRLRVLSPVIATMVAVVFVDAARTLLESLYFGVWYTARTGLVPRYLFEVLAQPQYVAIPKVVNLLAAFTILGVVGRRWFADVKAEMTRHKEVERLYGELAQAHKKLQEAQDARAALTHFMVHDMRVSLTSVITGLQTIQQWEPPGGLTAEMIDAARAGSERVLDMVNDMLDVARMESGEMTLSLEEFPVTEVIDEALAVLEPSLRQKQLAARVRLADAQAERDGRVRADRGKVRRVVANLLSNAVKFSPEGSTVEITVTPEPEGFVRVGVTDHGPGIAPEHQSRIFDRFYQVQAGVPNGRPGSGLGLSFCKLAVELQGGRIGVESTPGEGSRFWFTLPTPDAK
ncbi:MAG: HAMP domain-containing histidine kinase [Armatimonadetes bacterium]|nr:HAMP domain-containing histidine kinase [Armatimonadota bacterium]